MIPAYAFIYPDISTTYASTEGKLDFYNISLLVHWPGQLGKIRRCAINSGK
jgi:hypothetical protein